MARPEQTRVIAKGRPALPSADATDLWDSLRRVSVKFLAFVAYLALACPALADTHSQWQISPYLWIASFNGTVGGSGGDAATGNDAQFDHAWENTGLAGAMVNVNWRRDRWTVFGDWTYANVSSESPTRPPASYDSVEAQIKGNVVQTFAGYDLLKRENNYLDVYGGARYYNLDLSVEFKSEQLPDEELAGSQGWLDGVVGLRWATKFAEKWRGLLQGDVGSGGSNLSWQVYAGIGYDFSWGTLFSGWRYLHVDYGSGSYELDVALTGPFLGASWTF